ncbi:hypothetical protein TWF718_008697 [Orbilia javanica]|uniref:Uncharacterized protein n=1 Tax=Orbilia javanica TaxID=47235 RepID=A0AAN8RB29_9PEZI
MIRSFATINNSLLRKVQIGRQVTSRAFIPHSTTIAATASARSFRTIRALSSPTNGEGGSPRMASEKSKPKPPVEEPAGCSALAGLVKSRWENNEYYLEQFANDPWYPVLKSTHEAIKELVPNYNISQIKEKFGGLRYYITLPEEIELKDGDTREDIQTRVYRMIDYAEAWVDGFEHARRNKEEEEEE